MLAGVWYCLCMVAKKKPSSKQPVPSPSRKSGSEPLPSQRISSGKATSASKARNAKAVSTFLKEQKMVDYKKAVDKLKKNSNKPGPLDDIGRALKSLVVIDVPREKRTIMPKKKK